MIGAPSSTFFTTSPHWGWLIVLYFFVGGLAGGSYFLAALISLFGRPEDRRLARLGYYIAFPCVVLCGLLLIADLGRPLRFWHMLIDRHTFAPMFKYWSPMSIGSWALLIFGFFSSLSFLGALAEDGRLESPALRRFAAPSALGRVVALVGGPFAFFIAGYTGVLLAVTNRPIWSDTSLLGLLFIVSAASSSGALIVLLADRFGHTTPGLADLHRLDRWVIALELLVLVAVMVALGPVLGAWLNAWGLLLLVAVALGMVAPLILSRGARWQANLVLSAVLVLVGGFLLRVVIVFSSSSV
jgi:protein NrfD